MQSISLDGGRAVPRYAFSDALELVPQRVRLTRWGTRHGVTRGEMISRGIDRV
jgi:hypothetical protein